MRKALAFAAALSALTLSGPAFAQSWQSINQRESQLESRINQGIGDGSLTRDEAGRLRSDFRDLETLEGRYRASGGGLSTSERSDLDHRFDALSARISTQRHDSDWVSINQRQTNLDARIDAGVRDGTLTREEAYRLRGEFNDLSRLEGYYRNSSGLSDAERRDLDTRFDALSARINRQRTDQQSYGNNYHAPNYGRSLMRDREAFFQQDLVAARNQYSVPYADIIRLRDAFRVLVTDETRYLRDRRLDSSEQSDLDRRYDALQWRLEQLRRQYWRH